MLMFRTLRWKNLLSTGNYWSEIKLDSSQNTLVIGENGSGKSTMLDALCFVLFGKAFRNINKPNLLNSINNKDCVVEIEFDTNNKSYKVIRGIKPNRFEIFQNGELLNQDASSRDYQELLEKSILKQNYKSFTQIVILGSASFVPFMQLSASDRRSIIEELLDIEIFSSMNTILKDKISNNKDLILDKKYQIDMKQQKYEILQKHLNTLKENVKEKVESLQKEISSVQNQIQDLTVENEKINNKISEKNNEIKNKLIVENKIKELIKMEITIESSLTKIDKDISFFEKNDNCPTCKQSIAEDFKSHQLDCLSNRKEEIQSGLIKLKDTVCKEQNILQQFLDVQETISQLNINVVTNNTTITESQKYIDKLNKQIVSLQNDNGTHEEQEQEIKDIKLNLKTLAQEMLKLKEDKLYYDAASSLLKDTGIKTRIIKQYLPIINKLVNKYLTSLDFFVNFNLDESFKETIKSRHRDEFTYNSFSEGEKQRIDMALMLTWRAVAKLKNSANTNLLILDEVFDSSLDINGTDELMKLLHMLDNVNLFVISHKGDILQDKFNNVIRFQKVKNFSRIVK